MKNITEMRRLIADIHHHRNQVKEALDLKDQTWLDFTINELSIDLSRLKQANEEQKS
jgi:hypothetical protein